MIELPKGVEEITADNKQITLSQATISVSSQTITISSIGFVVISSYTSDVYFLTQDQSISILENSYAQIILDLPCSSSGSTAISYSLVEYNGNLIPNWGSIDSTSGVLTLDTPDLSSDTEYNFSISSSISGTSTPVLKHIKLSVQICKVVNWSKCSKKNRSYWDACNSGYNLDSGLCYLPKSKIESKIESNIEKTFSIVLQVFAWITLAICLISNYMNPSSISSFWSMVNCNGSALLFCQKKRLLWCFDIKFDIQKINPWLNV